MDILNRESKSVKKGNSILYRNRWKNVEDKNTILIREGGEGEEKKSSKRIFSWEKISWKSHNDWDDKEETNSN